MKSFLRNILFLVTWDPGFLDGALAESQLSLIGCPVSTPVVNRMLHVKDSQGHSCGSSHFVEDSWHKKTKIGGSLLRNMGGKIQNNKKSSAFASTSMKKE